MKWVYAVILLLLPSFAYADLSSYPGFFVSNNAVNAYFVVGQTSPKEDVEALIKVADSLGEDYSVPEENIVLDNMVGDISNKNIISFGNSCHNSVTASIIGTTNCTSFFAADEGIIKAFSNGNATAIVVAGLFPEATLLAGEYLADYKNKEMSGNTITIRFELPEEEVIKLTALEALQQENLNIDRLDLRYFPLMFFDGSDFNAEIIVGEKAPASYITGTIRFTQAMQAIGGVVETGTTKTDRDIVSAIGKNLILVGNACDNEMIKDFLKLNDCEAGLDKGIIKLFDNKGKTIMVISGDEEGVVNALDILSDFRDHDMKTSTVFVYNGLVKKGEWIIEEKAANRTFVFENKTKEHDKSKIAADNDTIIIFENKTTENKTEGQPEIKAKAKKPGIIMRIINWILGLFR